MTVNANPGKLADSFEQNPETSEGFETVRLQTDEVWEKVFGQTWSEEDEEKLLVSPYFANRDASNRDSLQQQTTNEETVKWLQMLEREQDENGYMHIYWYTEEDDAPKLGLYNAYPGTSIVVFTKADMSDVNTMEKATEVLKQNTNNSTKHKFTPLSPPPLKVLWLWHGSWLATMEARSLTR